MGMLDGLRVVEMGLWVAVPAAAGILADWGADVVKIEPPAGDPMRAMFRLSAGSLVDRNPPFDLDNRGKRSVVIDVTTKVGRDLAYRIVERADVFVTNMRPDALARMGFDHETLRARFPRLVYATVTGYGLRGPERNRPGYDVGAFWARSGVAWGHIVEGGAPAALRGGLGDHVTAMSIVTGILAALHARERTGEGRLVETSLLRTAMYTLGWDLSIQLEFDKVKPPVSRTDIETPLMNSYRAGDGRWFFLIGLEADRHFPGVARVIERPEIVGDPRFASARDRRHNRQALIALFDEAFATRPLAEWAERFDREGVWWAPVQSYAEVVRDPQATAAGALIDVPNRAGATSRTIATPIGFDGAAVEVRAPSPLLGEHTDEVLREVGVDAATLVRLRAEGVLGPSA
jgi:crotonobetainyl-CoA:carnitine CoA-transferase CaiB-like acyl-CoA transferase